MQLPLIGSISVKGLTLDQAENLVAERLKVAIAPEIVRHGGGRMPPVTVTGIGQPLKGGMSLSLERIQP
jgi:protein involved in polysaccharide export with SLBB domain